MRLRDRGRTRSTPAATPRNVTTPRVSPRTDLSQSRLLRFPGGLTRDPAIERWFDARPAALVALARPWFQRMRDCGADVRELLHDGHPTACVGDAAFGYANLFRAHVNVGFFRGASLPDPARLLEGDGRYMRHVKLRPGHPIDAGALEALIVAAYRDMQARLAAGAP